MALSSRSVVHCAGRHPQPRGRPASPQVTLAACAYNLQVRITFDPAKSERNVRLRGLSFERAADFAFGSAVFAVDDRKDYGQTRIIAFGLLGDRVHVLCFTETAEGIRVISFRKANAREVNRYAQIRSADQD